MRTGTPLVAGPPVAGGLDLDLPGDGVRLRATRWPGSGTPVLLLHGLASSRRFWDLVVPHLAGLPLLALDQRGHGESDRPAGPYDGASTTRDALTALDALGLSRAVVVGQSWGATTALRLAADAPERVLAVVALDGGLGWHAGAVADRAALRERMTPPRTALPPDRLPDGLARPRLPFEAHMAIVDDLIDADVEQVLPRIACPAWVVLCEPGGPPADDDAVRWSHAKGEALARAAGLLARPRLQRWYGALHDVPLQWPALVAGLVRTAGDEASVLRAAA